MKIIQIDGFKGLVTVAVIAVCTFCGFVICPGYAAMSLWNTYLAEGIMFPTLSLFQGCLLWGIVVLSYCILTQKGFAVSLKNTPELSDDEINSIIRSAKRNAQLHVMKKMVINNEKINKENANKQSSDMLKSAFISSPSELSKKEMSAEDSEINEENITKVE